MIASESLLNRTDEHVNSLLLEPSQDCSVGSYVNASIAAGTHARCPRCS